MKGQRMNMPPDSEAKPNLPVPSTDERHPNSRENPNCRENLMPAWQPGQSGNPGGRPRGSWGAGDYLRYLSTENITISDLRDIVADPDQPAGRVAAARLLLNAAGGAEHDVRPAEQRAAFDSVVDRLEGKPTQAHAVVDTRAPDIGRVLADARRELVGGDANMNALPAPAAEASAADVTGDDHG